MAISVSNPTTATGRVSASHLLQGRYAYLRQDLNYLRSIALGQGARRPLSNSPAPSAEAKKSLLLERDRLISTLLPVETVHNVEYPLPKHPDAAVPLCNLYVEGLPIRPQGVKMSGNAVCLMRQFGSRPGQPPLSQEIDALLTQFEPGIVRETITSIIFTAGTKAGFENRLGLLTSPTCKSINRVVGFDHQVQMRHLERLLPCDGTQLPNWMEGDDLLSLLGGVSVTGHASAGAPYWRKKGDCMEHVFHVVELLANHIKDGTLDDLLKQQPELFLIECKNKADRYEFGKLKDKTRPYFCPPAHWALIASYLFQGVSKGLHKVGGPVPTTNCYGWSAAGGGINALVADIKRRLKKGERGWCYVYGDDGDVYIVVGGKLYRVSPDIKQMDSCVDFDTVVLTFQYVKHLFTRQHGESRLWSMLIDALIAFMRRPRIMVSGTQLYTKEEDGLMSGIVGTTLFDTVKASVSYTDLLESHAADPSMLLDPDYVSRYMMEKYGLRLKEGTWIPELVNLDPVPAGIDVDGHIMEPEASRFGVGKFLGTQYVLVNGPRHPQWVPWIEDEDWMKCILAPRETDSDTKQTPTARLRTQFDRIRGYLTTGAVFSRPIRKALEYWTDTIPAEIILMQPQGTLPPEGVLLGLFDDEEWSYPHPEFLPNWKWVFDVYASPGNRYDEPVPSLFSDQVLALVSEARQRRRKVKLRLENGEVVAEPFVPQEPLSIGVELEAVVCQTPPTLQSHWKGPPPERVKTCVEAIPVPGVPLDLALEQTETQAVASALNAPPVPPFLHFKEDVIPLEEARTLIVDQPPMDIPPMMRTDNKVGTQFAHAPTPGGALGPPLQLDATLVHDDFSPVLKDFVAIGPDKNPHAAALMIFSKHNISVKVKSGGHVQYGSQQLTVGEVWLRRNLNMITGEGDNKKSVAVVEKPGRLVQIWHGGSMKEIREAVLIWVTMRNKTLAKPLLDQVQAEDWSLGADSSRVPFSEVLEDARPAPPPQLALPQCPATIPVERQDGEVVVPVAELVEVEGVPPPLQPRKIPRPTPKILPVPTPRRRNLPDSELPHIERTELRWGRRIYVRASDSEDSEPELYENAAYIPDDEEDEKGEGPNYLGIGEITEMLRNAGSLSSKRSPLNLKPQPQERYTIDLLKTLLNKLTNRNARKERKQKPPKAEGPPPLPPKPATKPKAPKGPKRAAGGSGSPSQHGGGRQWREGPRNPRTGNRPPLDKGGR